MGKKNTEVKISTILGKDCEISGDFTASGSARIDGLVDGNVSVTGSLIVAATGIIRGAVTADAVVIGGEVYGNINAPSKAELTTTAKVFGDISTKIIVIDEHAVFQGNVNMSQEAEDRKTKAARARAVRAGRKSAKEALTEALKADDQEANLGTPSWAAEAEETASMEQTTENDSAEQITETNNVEKTTDI